VISLVFIVSFIGALHAPGPHSIPVAVVGRPAQASSLSTSLNHQAPGGYTVTSYPTQAAARNAILTRGINAAVVPGPPQQLLVASATSVAATNATIKDIQAALGTPAQPSAQSSALQDIRPLPPNDPEGLSHVFFVVALLAPSLVFANLLISKFGTAMHPVGHILAIAVYAVIVAAVATAFADPVIGTLTGRPGAYSASARCWLSPPQQPRPASLAGAEDSATS